MQTSPVPQCPLEAAALFKAIQALENGWALPSLCGPAVREAWVEPDTSKYGLGWLLWLGPVKLRIWSVTRDANRGRIHMMVAITPPLPRLQRFMSFPCDTDPTTVRQWISNQIGPQ